MQTPGEEFDYSPYYAFTSGPAPNSPIGAPQQVNFANSLPSVVYLGEEMQGVPYSEYQLDPEYTNTNSLWIAGGTAWTQHAVVPQGSTLLLLANSPTGGDGTLTYTDPNEQTYSQDYTFYPNSLLTFNAATTGRHLLSFATETSESNQVVIDVTPVSTTQTIIPTTYYPGYWWHYYPGYYSTSILIEDGRYHPDHHGNNRAIDHHGNNPDGMDNRDTDNLGVVVVKR